MSSTSLCTYSRDLLSPGHRYNYITVPGPTETMTCVHKHIDHNNHFFFSVGL